MTSPATNGECPQLLLQLRARELRQAAERRLRGVEAEAEILVAERRVHVRRLVPVRVPPGANLATALVLAEADGRDEVLERRAVRVRHVRTHLRRVVRRVLRVR